MKTKIWKYDIKKVKAICEYCGGITLSLYLFRLPSSKLLSVSESCYIKLNKLYDDDDGLFDEQRQRIDPWGSGYNRTDDTF